MVRFLSVVKSRQTVEQRLDVGRRDARERLLAVLHGLCGVDAALEQHLGLPDELRGSSRSRPILNQEIVRDREHIEIAKLDRELLQALGELGIGALRARDFLADHRGVLLAFDFEKAIERAAQRLGAFRARGRREVPFHELDGDDALPSELVAERHVLFAARLIAAIGHLEQRPQGFVALSHLLMEDLGAPPGHATDLFFVALDLHQLGEMIGHARPVLDLFAELGEPLHRAEVFGIEATHHVERADGALRLVERSLVEISELVGDLELDRVLGGRFQATFEGGRRWAG